MAKTIVRGIFFNYWSSATQPPPSDYYRHSNWIPGFSIGGNLESAYPYWNAFQSADYTARFFLRETVYDEDGKRVGARYSGDALATNALRSRAVFTLDQPSDRPNNYLPLTISNSAGQIELIAPTIQEPTWTRSYTNGQPPTSVSFAYNVGDDVPYEYAYSIDYAVNIGKPTVQYGHVTLSKIGGETIQQGFFEDPNPCVEAGVTYDNSIIFAPSLYSSVYRITEPAIAQGIRYYAYYDGTTGEFKVTGLETIYREAIVTDVTITASPFTRYP